MLIKTEGFNPSRPNDGVGVTPVFESIADATYSSSEVKIKVEVDSHNQAICTLNNLIDDSRQKFLDQSNLLYTLMASHVAASIAVDLIVSAESKDPLEQFSNDPFSNEATLSAHVDEYNSNIRAERNEKRANIAKYTCALVATPMALLCALTSETLINNAATNIGLELGGTLGGFLGAALGINSSRSIFGLIAGGAIGFVAGSIAGGTVSGFTYTMLPAIIWGGLAWGAAKLLSGVLVKNPNLISDVEAKAMVQLVEAKRVLSNYYDIESGYLHDSLPHYQKSQEDEKKLTRFELIKQRILSYLSESGYDNKPAVERCNALLRISSYYLNKSDEFIEEWDEHRDRIHKYKTAISDHEVKLRFI